MIYGIDTQPNSDNIIIVMAELLKKGIIKIHKPILLTSKPVVNGFYQKILRENVIILDKNIKHYFEGPQRHD